MKTGLKRIVIGAVIVAACGATAVATAITPGQGNEGVRRRAPKLYVEACAVCHAAGVAGAPKAGNQADWAPRMVRGIGGLTSSAIKGKGSMPPRGGVATATDIEIGQVVAYMVSRPK